MKTGENHLKALIFDMGNVVLNVDHMKACRKFSEYTDFPEEEIHKKIIGTNLEDSFERGKVSINDFYVSVMDRIRADIPFKDFNIIFSDVFSLNAGMTDVISWLKGRARIILLSNTNVLHFSWVQEKFDVLKNFEKKVLSYETGTRKPEKEIYLYALDFLGCRPEEALYIDDIKDFIDSSKKLGMNGILFKSFPGFVSELKEYFPGFPAVIKE